MSDDTPSLLNNVITIDDERIKSHLDRVVRGTVEETLNALLDAEADRLCNAQRYERSEARRDTRAGHYERGLQTKAGEVRSESSWLRVAGEVEASTPFTPSPTFAHSRCALTQGVSADCRQ
jgi:putative transposase